MADSNKKPELNDLVDLSGWSMAPIWTLEQAALIWANINPTEVMNMDEARRIYPYKYQSAAIALQAFLGGIMLKALTVHELYVLSDDINRYSFRVERVADYSITFEDVDIQRTTVMQSVLIEWARRNRCLSLKARLSSKKQPSNSTDDFEIIEGDNPKTGLMPENTAQALLPYTPKYATPSYDVLVEVIREYYDNLPEGVEPEKQEVIWREISLRYEKSAGVKPSANIVKQIDAIARPLRFKNNK